MHRAWVRDGFQVSVVPGWVASERGMPGYVNVRQKLMMWTRCTRLRPMRRASQEARGGRGGEAPGGAPGGRCPKCHTVAHRLHFGAHLGRWFFAYLC